MRWFVSLTLMGLWLVACAPESSAQWFGSKKPKVPPQQRMSELIVDLKYDKDTHKRADAAEELRQFDPKDFPEIIPVLIEALQNDQAYSVRIEAARGLGRLRPISVAAGQALEKAAASDTNYLVRGQATLSLGYYQLSGYHGPKKDEPAGPKTIVRTDEPPLADPNMAAGAGFWQSGIAPNSPPVPGSTTTYRALPSGPPGQITQVPIVTMPASAPPVSPPQVVPPPASAPQPSAPPTAQAPLQLQWTPIQQEGPKLVPPD